MKMLIKPDGAIFYNKKSNALFLFLYKIFRKDYIMNKNNNLRKAKEQKKDEFYTQLSDIENELRHYKQHFKDKVVFCNCDDPYESNFFKYFAMNFNSLGLKKLIATGYVTSPVAGKEISLFDDEDDTPENQPYVVYINEVTDINGDGRTDLDDVKLLLRMKKNIRRKLHGDDNYPAGDFRSEESIALLKQADIVVTNPPFSLFREYVEQLIEYKKKFLIIGNQNAIQCKEIFPLFKNNLLWLGNNQGGSRKGNSMFFIVPDYYNNKYVECVNGIRLMQTTGKWFTNLDVKIRHEELILYKHYNPNEHPKYFNYDAIDVDKTKNIPCDYDGVMGVPITFLDKYNPAQFEIIGLGSQVPKTKEHIAYKDKGIICYEVDGKPVWTTPYTVNERKIGNSLRIEKNGIPANAPYGRILIRKRKSVVSE